jgi:endonuclease-3 related protein
MTRTIQTIYNKLLSYYGKQYWWPAETIFEVVIGAILTQNTAWTNVEKSIKNLKEKGLLTPEAIYNLPIEKLEIYIKPSGFYRLKAKRIKTFMNFFKNYNFDFEKLKLERNLREKLLNIKGIGPETADSILLYALDMPYFVIDSYTKRIFFRYGLIEKESIDYHELQNLIHKCLKPDIEIYKEYHALIVEHAKKQCKRNIPLCSKCTLKNKCSFSKKRDTYEKQ